MRLTEITLAWLAYFAVHSLLASSTAKAAIGIFLPRLMPGYRLFFNLVATLTLVPVLWLVYRNHEANWLWQWHGAWSWLSGGLSSAAIIGLLASTRTYDMKHFLGLRQLGEGNGNTVEKFSISYFHRYVRHPWYSFSLVLIWTRDMNGAVLVSALLMTAYFVVGSWLEERKLIACHGQVYRRYIAAVPGLLPLPWKFLSVADANALVQE